jgi:hypothetical protein
VATVLGVSTTSLEEESLLFDSRVNEYRKEKQPGAAVGKLWAPPKLLSDSVSRLKSFPSYFLPFIF